MAKCVYGVFFWLFVVLLLPVQVKSQTYYFTNYGLKQGLAQSQVSVVFQAKNHTLWLGTYGGVSNFNGVNFVSYGKAEGLASGMINCITETVHQKIILGTDVGLSTIQHDTVKNYSLPKRVSSLSTDKQGRVWGISGGRVFWFANGKFTWIKALGLERASLLAKDKQGELYLFCYGKGIFKVRGLNWKLFAALDQLPKDTYVKQILFDQLDRNKFYIVANWQLWHHDGHALQWIKMPNAVFGITQDKDQNLWVGTEFGAQRLDRNGQVMIFNGQNGLSNNKVDCLFTDCEQNVWLSVFGEGIYKYEGDGFLRFNTFKGRNVGVPISHLMADSANNLFIGTYSHGIYQFRDNNLKKIGPLGFEKSSVLLISKDLKGNLWFSVEGSGIWKKTGDRFELKQKSAWGNFNGLVFENDGGYLVSSPSAICHVLNGKVQNIKGRYKGYISQLFNVGDGRILMATNNGVYWLINHKIVGSSLLGAIDGVNVMHIARLGKLIILATLGDGIITYNLITKEVIRYTKKHGLNSNDVYSVASDQHGNLWAGTGRGVSVLCAAPGDRLRVVSTNSNLPEANQASILRYNNKILLGTIEGVVACRPDTAPDNRAPFIYFKSLTVKSQSYTKDSSIYNIAKNGPSLAPKQNHIVLAYRAVFLANPSNVKYQYRLIGLDTNFSSPTLAEFAEYSALKPGHYVFEVRATSNNVVSKALRVPFYIQSPFYATWWFLLLLLALFIALVYSVIKYRFAQKERQKKLLDRIKLEEQRKIRQQTSEDFHDDIGNKLTRINVLSEILDHKIDPQNADQKKLVMQIRESANLLYAGTKDILWALDPKSGNLYEILSHINDFGCDLFSQTGTVFQMEGIDPNYQSIQLSMEYNRNFSLIFKEVLNNCLKYAKAKNVLIVVAKNHNGMLELLVCDDGVGFDANSPSLGKGLKNIKTRAQRIHAHASINSKIGMGATVKITTGIAI